MWVERGMTTVPGRPASANDRYDLDLVSSVMVQEVVKQMKCVFMPPLRTGR